jgi:sugar lactone lactonase YvrE
MKYLKTLHSGWPIILVIFQCVIIQPSHAQTLGQALDEPTWPWYTGGSAWYVVANPSAVGGYCAKVGALGYPGQDYLQTMVTGPGTLTFYYASPVRVSSFQLQIDSGTPVSLTTINRLNLTAYSTSIPSGSHLITWTCSFSSTSYVLLDNVSLTSSGIPPTITTTSPLASGTVASSYSQTLFATGGTMPYYWSVISGGLPAGLSLSTAGVISGTPSMATNASFTVQVMGADGGTASRSFSLAIVLAQPTITTTSLSTGMAGTAYSTTLSVSGSMAPYTWSIINGGLPAGLALSSAGTISGTPLEMTNNNFTVQVTGNNGLSTNNVFSLAIVPADVVYAFTNFAGMPGISGYIDATGTVARFDFPEGVVVDGTSNVFVADRVNFVIRKVTPAGAVTTLPGGFDYPSGVAVDSTGNVFVANYWGHTIDKISPGGAVTTIAGSYGVSGSADGTNSTARFNVPVSVAADNAGNLYVADSYNSTIRKITPVGANWVVTTLAGSPGVAGSVDGTNSSARFSFPEGVAVDSSGNVFVGDTGSYTIRKLIPVGTNWVVTTLAGSPSSSGFVDTTSGGVAQFVIPSGVAADSTGNVYVTDGNSIRKVTATGIVTTIAGVGFGWGTNDGIGSTARFGNNVGEGPSSVAVDSAGNLYVADYGNHRISKGIPINRPTITITSPLPFGIVGTAYSQTLRASGGITPYTWTIVSGSLPPGLTLSSDGIISGTPSVMTTNSFIVQVTGSNGLVSTNAFTLCAVIRGCLSVQSNSASGLQLNITGVVGGLYVVQVSTNLTSWNSFQTNYAPFIFTDTNSHNYPRRFYRTLYLP